MADDGSLKREYRIDSSDSARPAATLEAEPFHYAQGLKPKPRVLKSVEFEVLEGQFVPRGKKQPPAQLVLRTATYDDGTTIDCTVGEDNEEYQQYLTGTLNIEQGSDQSTRVHRPTRKPEAPTRKAAAKKG